uniref:Uncharacterized protein n=1 Tax=Trypanosoma vivax (strain Y486) TaxID=1055687 RepID=G0U1M0_TRYVY|nr:conserved hypothetical protein, fragment [Trypanosoma vivax Y486]
MVAHVFAAFVFAANTNAKIQNFPSLARQLIVMSTSQNAPSGSNFVPIAPQCFPRTRRTILPRSQSFRTAHCRSKNARLFPIHVILRQPIPSPLKRRRTACAACARPPRCARVRHLLMATTSSPCMTFHLVR